jgi:arsenate reductase
MGVSVRALIRKKEGAYLRLGLDDRTLDDAALATALSENPILIERPVVFSRGRAVIGRPPDAILTIL